MAVVDATKSGVVNVDRVHSVTVAAAPRVTVLSNSIMKKIKPAVLISKAGAVHVHDMVISAVEELMATGLAADVNPDVSSVAPEPVSLTP